MAPWWFTALALTCSALLGIFSVRIFDSSPPASIQDKEWKEGRWQKSKALPWLIYQAWYNFVGSLAGWAALLALEPARWFAPGRLNVTWGSAALAAVAFAGITGHLPFALQQLLVSVALILRPVGKVLEKWFADA